MLTYYIAPSGKLYTETRVFIKGCHIINGVKLTELWCDAYNSNLNDSAVLFPADFNCPFEITEHIYNREEFIRKGGGFRLDLI